MANTHCWNTQEHLHQLLLTQDWMLNDLVGKSHQPFASLLKEASNVPGEVSAVHYMRSAGDGQSSHGTYIEHVWVAVKAIDGTDNACAGSQEATRNRYSVSRR